jgi:LuxR family quorum sensing-dependent transcriptional regulator
MRTDVALRFFEHCARETDTSAVVDAFLSAIRAFGFESCAAGAWVGVGRRRTHRFYFNNWPQAWFEIYESKGLVFKDPVVAEARRRMAPFLWSDLAQSHSFRVVGAVVAEAYAYGWREVMVVPLHGPAGYQGAVSLGALAPVSLSPVERTLLRAMALAVHDRCHETVGLGDAIPSGVTFSQREIECMQWVAAGKTDSEIGQILELSPATVHFHIERVKRKLDTSSRTHAVGLLVLAGLI